MRLTPSPSDYDNLLVAIHDAFRAAFRDPKQREEQLVANLVWRLPKQLNDVTLSGGNSLRTGGVFVHRQPLVKADSFPDAKNKSVEIGDLLLLRTAYHNGCLVDRRAMLLQAKKTKKLPARPDNKNQYHLYADWPRFEYVQSTPRLNGQRRHIRGFDVHNAAKFLLISDGSSSWPGCGTMLSSVCRLLCLDYHCQTVTAHPTKPHLTHHRCFAMDLLEFILGDSGKTYQTDIHHRANGWDKVIEDLTTITAERNTVFIKRASSGESSTRGDMMRMHFLSGEMPLSRLGELNIHTSDADSDMQGPPEVTNRDDGGGDEEGRGISILEFTISSEGPLNE